MDSAVVNAITAVELGDEGTRLHWFELVCRTYNELAASDQLEWRQFTSSLADGTISAGLSSNTAEQFVQFMSVNDLNPLETIGRMRDLADELPTLYQQLAAARVAEDVVSDDGYDEATWNAFLAEHGPYWNGDPTAWDQFRTWFLYQAEQHNLTDPAQAFINYTEKQSDKPAVFAQYGIAIADAAAQHDTAVDVSAHPDVQHGDSGEWVEYLDQMLTRNGF